VLVLTDRR